MKPRRLLKRIRSGAVKNVDFGDFVRLIEALGFRFDHQRGDHKYFRHPDLQVSLNIQEEGGQAKPYQVRQLVKVMKKYSLDVEVDRG
ncbi:MAG: type II toxin-antitoxin system HicA family toxin [Actinomycetota bacterium]